MTEAVLYDCKDGLARITLNRPAARNALNSAMCEALVAATRRAREDGARCVLVSGEPRLLQAGLNAGLWTIGLASCGSLCGLAPEQWQALTDQQREYKRGKATVALRGPARDLLLAVVRRGTAAELGLEMFGDDALWKYYEDRVAAE